MRLDEVSGQWIQVTTSEEHVTGSVQTTAFKQEIKTEPGANNIAGAAKNINNGVKVVTKNIDKEEEEDKKGEMTDDSTTDVEDESDNKKMQRIHVEKKGNHHSVVKF